MKKTALLFSFLLVLGSLNAQHITNNSFRVSGFTLRPEIGFNIPLNNNGNNLKTFLFSPSAKLAIGYQSGPHFFFGVIGGLGGSVENKHDTSTATLLFPIMANTRWYLIDHKYSFIIDAQGGINMFNDINLLSEKYINYCWVGKLNFGFAIGNLEATLGSNWIPEEMLWGFAFDISYRFGNFQKWW